MVFYNPPRGQWFDSLVCCSINILLWQLITSCPWFLWDCIPLPSHPPQSTQVTTTSSVIYPLSSRRAPSRGMLHSSQYSCTFSHMGHTDLLSCCAFCRLATHAAFSFLSLLLSTSMFGHSYLWCPTPQHLKHFTPFSFLSCYLTSTSPLTPHCITQLANTLNLFLRISFPSSSPILFLQLQTRCYQQTVNVLSDHPRWMFKKNSIEFFVGLQPYLYYYYSGCTLKPHDHMFFPECFITPPDLVM